MARGLGRSLTRTKNGFISSCARNGGPITSYSVPTNFGRGVQELSPDCVRISPDKNRLEMLLVERYFRWNLKSHRLERDVSLRELGVSMTATIARDGESIVSPNFGLIKIASTKTGQSPRIVPLQGVRSFESMRVSPLGYYALYDAPGTIGPSRFNVVDVQTGRALWQFDLDSLRDYAEFSSDEKWLALPLTQRKIWQIRDTKTGKFLRTLPLVPGAHGGAFSPDGATLYSVANGILYRQRAPLTFAATARRRLRASRRNRATSGTTDVAQTLGVTRRPNAARGAPKA